MLPHFFPPATHDKDIVDMDTQQRIRYTSESSMSGTSGYNTTSPGPGNSPSSTGYSPAQSPATALQTDFLNLTLPGAITFQQNSSNLQLINANIQQQVPTMYPNNLTSQYNYPINYQQSTQQTPANDVKQEYEASLVINEQPVEKFRFRYKSEMHGTHGCLHGTSSQRNVKRFPEVELKNYKAPAVIRCSLFQTNLNSPHSHQLVIRKDDHDICDPHEIKVSEEIGYYAEWKNMGIIHTAKKFIVEELLKKKRKRMLFELSRDFLTTKGEQELNKQTEKEAKEMNLNQVRLCFEAFHVDENNFYTPIAKPIYSNPINNRKSAQTGELRITRLSIATGSVSGGEDLILLVEKVSKKNIKVRFFEMNDDELVWESFAVFRESDVHHQYAITCRTPAYKDKDIDKSVEVFIELVRPLDDERSYPPVSFRYKPRDAVISRKRRKTCSSGSGNSSNNSGSLSSGEIPKTVFDKLSDLEKVSLTEELFRLMNDPEIQNKSMSFPEELFGPGDVTFMDSYDNNNLNCAAAVTPGRTEKDGACVSETAKSSILHYKKKMISKKQMDIAKIEEQNQFTFSSYIQRIFNIFSNTRSAQPLNATELSSAAEQITKIFNEHFDINNESLIHEIVVIDNYKLAIPLFNILNFFKLNNLLNIILNKRNQSALHYACLHDRPHYIRPLLRLGCNPNIQDIEGDTALHITVREKHYKCLESFINSAMALKFNILNYDGFTPLHLAIRDNNYEMASKILKYDETIAGVANSKDGNNALHMVIQQQNLMLVKLILDNPIMVSITCAPNTAGNTPLDLAKLLPSSSTECQEILNLLVSHNKLFSSASASSSAANISLSSSHNLRMSMDDVDDGKLVVKEEDNSCSSTEDEEDSSSLETMLTHEIEIKEEIHDYFNSSDLKAALNNPEIFKKLCLILDENKRWQILADKLHIKHFYLTNAEGLLNKIKRVIHTINLNSFALELQNIDKNLIEFIKKQ